MHDNLLHFQIEFIFPQHLKSLPHISHFNLYQNNLQIIRNYTFMALTHLVRLTLDENRITRLEYHSFYGLYQLKYLSLKWNYIKAIHLGDLPPGVKIILTSNQITGDDGLLGLPWENWEFFELMIKHTSGMPSLIIYIHYYLHHHHYYYYCYYYFEYIYIYLVDEREEKPTPSGGVTNWKEAVLRCIAYVTSHAWRHRRLE